MSLIIVNVQRGEESALLKGKPKWEHIKEAVKG